MAAWDKDYEKSDAPPNNGGSWRSMWVFVAGCVCLLVVLWIVMNAAGTVWSIPVAIIAVIVGGIALIQSER